MEGAFAIRLRRSPSLIMKMTNTISLILLLVGSAASLASALANKIDKTSALPRLCNTDYVVAHFEQSALIHESHIQADSQLESQADSQLESHAEGHKKVDSQELVLIRKGQRVAHYNPQQKIANIWFLSKHNQQQLTRVFEPYQQGIEYQADELKAPSQWHYVRSLVKQALLTRMTVEKTDGQGCQQVQHYTLDTAAHQYQLAWLSAVEIPQELVVTNKQNGRINRLQLVKLDVDNRVAKQVANQQFAKWDALPTTDYADVGDNENNPFLAKMINQGFSNSTNHQANHHHANHSTHSH